MDQTGWDFSDFIGLATVVGAIATAVATYFLFRVTKLLAKETTRMADASAQPQVVANISPSPWAINHCDLTVSNTGNATAFDIELKFDPPLKVDDEGIANPAIPFQRISLLKPGQSLKSYLNETFQIIDTAYNVTVSWRLKPDSSKRETLSYIFNMDDYKGMSTLGASDPSIQIAEQLKKLREDWQWIANGSKKIKADTYAKADRDEERKLRDARFKAQQAAHQPEAPQPESLTVPARGLKKEPRTMTKKPKD